MLTLLIGLLIGYGQTGVRLDAYIPANQSRVIVGRVSSDLSGEVWILTEDRYLFVGTPVYAEFVRGACFLVCAGQQDGIEAVAAMEFEDGKQDRGYIAIAQVLGSGGDFGLPGEGARAFPRRPGGDAVQIYRGGK